MTVFNDQPLSVTAGGVTIDYNASDPVLRLREAFGTLVVAQEGMPYVDIISCDSVEEARELVNLACAETVGGRQ